MRYSIRHNTSYTYLEPVSLCHNIARLLPRDTPEQTCRGLRIEISPQPQKTSEYRDFFGNRVLYFSVEKEHRELKVNVTSEVEKKYAGPKSVPDYPKADLAQAANEIAQLKPDAVEIKQYLIPTPMTEGGEEIRRYALESFPSGRPVFEGVKDLNARIHHDFVYKPGFTTIATPLADLMKQKKGVCQDFAHFAISGLRMLGFPVRYVSGYIETISPEGTEKLVGVDASHAWFSVYIPDLGWVDFDPTNNCLAGDQHITIGWGRDYADIAPMEGIILSSGSHELKVSVDVKRFF